MALVSVMALAATAHAQLSAPPAQGAAAVVPGCSITARQVGLAPDDIDVGALSAEFQCWFAAAEYGFALAALEKACAASNDAACSFNRALLHHVLLAVPEEEEQEHCRLSRLNYADYLVVNPYSRQGDEARLALGELDQICEAVPSLTASPLPSPAPDVILPLGTGDAPIRGEPSAAQPPETRTQTQPPPLPEAAQKRTLPWLLFGAGAATALATTVSLVHMSRAYSDYLAHEEPDGDIFSYPENVARNRNWKRYEALAWGFGASSVLLLGAGATLLVLDAQGSPFSVVVAPGSARLGYGSTF